MKKSTSLLFSGLLVSGMVLGATVTTPTTVHADNTATTQATTNVTNTVSFYDQNGDFIRSQSLQGVQGSAINYAPDGYAIPTNNKAVFGADGSTVKAIVNQMISVKVNYVDQNNKIVDSEVVNGGVGNTYKLTDIPAGCSWVNDSEQTITLEQGKEYNVAVNRKVFNTLIFKTADNSEVGRTEVFGDKVGDKVELTQAQIPVGYKIDSNSITLQSDNNTQFITVTKADSGETATGVVTVNDKTAQLYTIYGNVISGRTLAANSSWKTFGTKVINGQTYYKVASNEWVNANDVTATNNTVTPFSNVVATSGSVAKLYDKNGKELSGRGLGPNTSWRTANKMVLNGKTYYQVATNEWVDASTVTVVGQTTNNDSNVKPAVGVVTIGSTVAQLYTKDGTAISDRALGPNSSWKTANKMTLNGETYYQVATNEWVKASNLTK